jgi:serine/threonine protein kinase
MTDRTLDQIRAAIDLPDLSGTPYVLREWLGEGGMGSVYAAEDSRLDRRVAIKILRLDNDIHEARALAALEHPGIVPVHDVGHLPDGRTFYVMKLVEGERLDRWAAGDRSLQERLRVFLKLCEAVAFAHAKGVPHLDLKPENVMLGAFGEVLVLDWGCPGAATAGYMAPEQVNYDGTSLSDIYALGRVLSSLVPDAPLPLRAIAEQASAELPAARYDRVEEMARDIERYLEGDPVSAYRESLFERGARVARRHQMALWLIGAYLFMRITILILFPN